MNPFNPPVSRTSRPMNPFEPAAPVSNFVDPWTDSQQQWSLSTSWPAKNSDPWSTPRRRQDGEHGVCGQPWMNQAQVGVLSSSKFNPASSGQVQTPLSGSSNTWPLQLDRSTLQDFPSGACPTEFSTSLQGTWQSKSSATWQRSSSTSWPPAPWPSSPVAWPSSEIEKPSNSGKEQGSSTSWQTQPWPSSGAVWPSISKQQQELCSTPWSADPWPSTTDAWPETNVKQEHDRRHHKHRHKHRKSSDEEQPSVRRNLAASSPPPAHELGRELMRLSLFAEDSDEVQESVNRKGILVRVIRARNLHNVEVFGRHMDPYVEVVFGSFKARTSVCTDGHTEPYWDQALRLPLRTSDLLGEQVVFSVFDKNKFMTDAHIGSGSTLYGGREEKQSQVSRTIPLYCKKSGDDAGTLEITLEFLDKEPSSDDYIVVMHQPNSSAAFASQNQSQQANSSNHNHYSSDTYNHQPTGGGGGGDPEAALIVGGVLVGVGLAAAGAGYAAHKLRRRSDGTNRW